MCVNALPVSSTARWGATSSTCLQPRPSSARMRHRNCSRTGEGDASETQTKILPPVRRQSVGTRSSIHRLAQLLQPDVSGNLPRQAQPGLGEAETVVLLPLQAAVAKACCPQVLTNADRRKRSANCAPFTAGRVLWRYGLKITKALGNGAEFFWSSNFKRPLINRISVAFMQ